MAVYKHHKALNCLSCDICLGVNVSSVQFDMSMRFRKDPCLQAYGKIPCDWKCSSMGHILLSEKHMAYVAR